MFLFIIIDCLVEYTSFFTNHHAFEGIRRFHFIIDKFFFPKFQDVANDCTGNLIVSPLSVQLVLIMATYIVAGNPPNPRFNPSAEELDQFRQLRSIVKSLHVSSTCKNRLGTSMHIFFELYDPSYPSRLALGSVRFF